MPDSVEKPSWGEAPEVLFSKVLEAALQIPGVRVDRDAFLRDVLGKRHSEEQVTQAIAVAPAAAGITNEEVRELADEVIRHETLWVTGTSAAAGIPGGLAMAATIPGDVAQYYGRTLRVAQKLGYLYGWGPLFQPGGERLNDGAMDVLTLFLGVMSGAAGANQAIGKMAVHASGTVAKRVAAQPLTKGVVYPIVKKTAGYLGIQMNKQIFGKSVGKVVPLIGGVVSGGLTLATFLPMSRKLRNELAAQPIADPAFYEAEMSAEVTTAEAEATEVEVVEAEPSVEAAGPIAG